MGGGKALDNGLECASECAKGEQCVGVSLGHKIAFWLFLSRGRLDEPTHYVGSGVLFFAEYGPVEVVLFHQVVKQHGVGEIGVGEYEGACWLQESATLLDVSGKNATRGIAANVVKLFGLRFMKVGSVE